jgi:hypothetical protein
MIHDRSWLTFCFAPGLAQSVIYLPPHVIESSERLPQIVISYYARLFETLPPYSPLLSGGIPYHNATQDESPSSPSKSASRALMIHSAPVIAPTRSMAADSPPYISMTPSTSVSPVSWRRATSNEGYEASVGSPGTHRSNPNSPISATRTCSECGTTGKFDAERKCVEKWGPGPMGRGTACDRCVQSQYSLSRPQFLQHSCYHAYKRKKARAVSKQESTAEEDLSTTFLCQTTIVAGAARRNHRRTLQLTPYSRRM